MKDEIELVIDEINHPLIKKVVGNTIQEHVEKFMVMPAACGHHHAYKGGLAVHSHNTARTAMDMVDSYEDYLYKRHGVKVDRDVVIAGALLHDIGKLYCYDFNVNLEEDRVTDIMKTVEDQLFHHIPIGFHMLATNIEKWAPDLERSKRNNLLHIIISHHGKVAYNSNREPQTLEAFLVHQADYLDAWIDNWGKRVR